MKVWLEMAVLCWLVSDMGGALGAYKEPTNAQDKMWLRLIADVILFVLLWQGGFFCVLSK